MSRRLLLIITLFLAVTLSCFAGPVPFFRNFSPSDYDAMSQNWSVAQDSKGYIYVGNNSCLLRFNGRGWDKFYPFGERNGAIIRSLFADSDRVYVGSFKDFGYVSYDEFGNMEYTSLYEKSGITAGDNDQIWYIAKAGNQIFFIYFTAYYVYDLKTEEIHRIDAPTSYYYSPDGCLYLASLSGLTRKYSGSSLSYDIVPKSPVPGSVLKTFTGPDGTMTAVSTGSGVYRIDDGKATRIDNLGAQWGVANRAIQCRDGVIVVGFISSGVYAFSPDGALLWHISTEEGLIDNTVLALLEDASGNIWCALDKGIAVIFKGGDGLLSLLEYNLGKPAVSLVYGNNLFVGSNHGLALFEIDRDRLTLNKTGSFFQDKQLWSLYEKDGQVFVGENGSTYLYGGGSMRQLSDAPGGVTPRLLTLRNGQEVMIQGSFTSLYLYEKKDGNWQFRNTVEGFMRPVKCLEVDYLGNIWIEHMYEGIYRIVLTDDGLGIESETVYPLQGARMCKIGGRVLFHNADGFMYFDDNSGDMKPFSILNEGVGEYKDCRRVIPAGYDRYWLVRKNDAILASYRNDSVKILDRVDCDDFNVNLTEQFETILSLPGDRFLFGVENGFLIHDLKSGGDFEDSPQILASSISYFHSGEKHPVKINSKKIVIPNNSSLILSFAVSGMKFHNSDLKYELVSYDYEPHVMDNSMSVSYQRLPHGSYDLRIWLDDKIGNMLAETKYSLVVKPSFFASGYAVSIYFVMALMLASFVYWQIKRMMKKQYMNMQAQKEKEIITLRNEQLEKSVLLKSKELATYSLIESRRSQVLLRLRQELAKIRYGKPGGMTKSEYDSLMSIIQEGEFSEDNWDKFYNNFDLIHQSFFRILSEKHPGLTSNDLRICAYLRLNMSTKELADIMNVTVKGAEAAKYRLRKKLGVNSSTPLNEYLTNIGK